MTLIVTNRNFFFFLRFYVVFFSPQNSIIFLQKRETKKSPTGNKCGHPLDRKQIFIPGWPRRDPLPRRTWCATQMLQCQSSSGTSSMAGSTQARWYTAEQVSQHRRSPSLLVKGKWQIRQVSQDVFMQQAGRGQVTCS